MSARTRYLAKKNQSRWVKTALNKDNKLVEVKPEPEPEIAEVIEE